MVFIGSLSVRLSTARHGENISVSAVSALQSVLRDSVQALFSGQWRTVLTKVTLKDCYRSSETATGQLPFAPIYI